MSEPSILFVDDEESLLNGLRRSLRRPCKSWRLEFAVGGKAGLDALKKDRFDIIFSDMRMPEMDGAQFLSQAKEIAPRSMRYVLSGEADRELTFATLSVSHRYFAKPIDTDELIEVSQRLVTLRDEIDNDELQTALLSAATLSVPRRVMPANVADESQSTPYLEGVARIYAAAAKLIQISNSAYFGVGPAVLSAVSGATRLGQEIIDELVERAILVDPDADEKTRSIVDRLLPLPLAVEETASYFGSSDDDLQAVIVATQFIAATTHICAAQNLLASSDGGEFSGKLLRTARFLSALWGATTQVDKVFSDAIAAPADQDALLLQAVAIFAHRVCENASAADVIDAGTSAAAASLSEPVRRLAAAYETARNTIEEAA